MSCKSKLFRDPVHGYIDVPDDLCSRYIDTDVFQRLRFIEQSSMRMLYPAARHDRFIHSLGVYAIAKRVYASIENRFATVHEDRTVCERFRETFLVAALLHDCAHAPFSHTGEGVAKKYCGAEIEEKLIEAVGSDEFRHDFYNPDARYATHELASAYVGCKRFASEFGAFVDKEQFARMITGIKNKHLDTPVNRAYNCLISLLNGFIVDVDRLDYLQRDTWATGICNASVDVDRLIAGIDVDVTKGRVCVRHTALSSFINAVSARDYIFNWVIPDHIVSYANEILERGIERLVLAMASDPESPTDVAKKLFSPDRLLPGGEVRIKGEVIYLPTDGDVLYWMKKYIPNDIYFKAYARRDKTHISLWKSYAEFLAIFKAKLEPRHLKSFSKVNFWELFGGKLKVFADSHPNCLFTQPRQIKSARRNLTKVEVDMDGTYSAAALGRKQLDLTHMFGDQAEDDRYYFNAYVYAPSADNDYEKEANEIIKMLQDLLKDTIDEYDAS